MYIPSCYGIAILSPVLKNRREFRKGNLGYALECILDLFLLAFQLKLIRKVLPSASAAYSEMAAARLLSHSGRSHKLFYVSFGIILFLTVKLDIGHIAGSAERYKDNHIIHPGKSIALSSDIGDLDILQQREFFFLSTHFLNIKSPCPPQKFRRQWQISAIGRRFVYMIGQVSLVVISIFGKIIKNRLHRNSLFTYFTPYSLHLRIKSIDHDSRTRLDLKHCKVKRNSLNLHYDFSKKD